MYEIEVKQALVETTFLPSQGWNVTVDIDGSEKGTAGRQSQEKRDRAAAALESLSGLGVTISRHPEYGRTDLVARDDQGRLFLVEVKGESTAQPEVSLYSALAQLLLLMSRKGDEKLHFVLAVPDSEAWEKQCRKLPQFVRAALGLEVWLVSRAGKRVI